MIYGYARVSTRSQARDGNSLEQQEAELRAHNADVIFCDSSSGGSTKRPQFDKLLSKIQSGDTLVVTKLDRFARSVSQASDLITELINNGVRIDVCNLGILDNGSVSKLMRDILLSFAEFERNMIIDRTQEGKAIARTNPNYREGRPRKYSPAQLQHALSLLDSHSLRQVEEMTGISKSTLKRAKKELEHAR